MNRPKFSTYVIGHPIVLLLASSFLLFGIYRWTQDPTSWPLTAIAFVFASASSKAGSQVDAYRSWKRDWDGMGESPAARTPRARDWVLFLAGTGGLLIAFNAAGKLPSPALLVVGFCAVVGFFTVSRLLQLIRRARRKRAAAEKKELVSVCVKAPLAPVPSLERAFSALPPHCHSILRPRN